MKAFFRSGILFAGAVAAGLFFAVAPVHADETYTFIVKKQDEKAKTHRGWNLADWLVQRDSMRTQDLWLAMHTPTPYEFYLGGDYRFLNSPKDARDHRFQFGAFAKIFGLTLENESDPGRWNALFNVRLFGLYQQGTNLTVFGGIRAQSEPETFRSAVFGASLTLYLMRYGGIETQYRKYGRGTSDVAGAGAEGTELEANLFIDFRFFRIYGGLLQTHVDPTRSEGVQIGGRFFF
jgi:hypothetical protein